LSSPPFGQQKIAKTDTNRTRCLFLLHRRLSSTTTVIATSPVANDKPNPPTHSEPLSLTLNKLFNERDPDKLTAAFIAASSSSYRFRCRHRIYEVSIRRLAKCGRPDAVEAILEHHKSFSSDLAHEGFGISLISLYGKAAMPAHAAATFRQLPDLGSTRTVKSFNALLTAYAQSGDLNGLDEAFRDVPDSITPDIISYNILIGALCEKGDLEAAMRTVDLMNTNAISPDLITCNILLHSFYNNKPSEAEKIWAMMRENNIEPNSRSINAKLRWLVAEGRTHEVIELVDQMKRNGPKPDAFTFNALLKGYIQDGNLEEAKKLYLDFAKNECSPNQQTFEFLISYLCEAGELDWAVRCCNDGMSRRCYVRASFLQAVVDALVKNSRVEEAKKLVEAGWNNRYPKTSLGLPESTQSLVV
ncbi:pentatricopeptide repeat-containing protein At1g55890, mitochondrial-like, partial [Zingiber officinale]|uniref:pentatricopeptide repeat-containing protein At1g55890, mitochondrial-like n=1 Tax=Zingiber officinale TaxID=94328 RepID=UPI001C4CA81C